VLNYYFSAAVLSTLSPDLRFVSVLRLRVVKRSSLFKNLAIFAQSFPWVETTFRAMFGTAVFPLPGMDVVYAGCHQVGLSLL
jgi:hypothetical protein